MRSRVTLMFCVERYMFGWALNEGPSSRRLGGGKYSLKSLCVRFKMNKQGFLTGTWVTVQRHFVSPLGKCVFKLWNRFDMLATKTCSGPVYLSVTQSSKLASGFFRTLFFFLEARGGGEGELSVISRQKKHEYFRFYLQITADDTRQWNELALCALSKSTSSGCFESPFVALAYSSHRVLWGALGEEVTQTHRSRDVADKITLLVLRTRPR